MMLFLKNNLYILTVLTASSLVVACGDDTVSNDATSSITSSAQVKPKPIQNQKSEKINPKVVYVVKDIYEAKDNISEIDDKIRQAGTETGQRQDAIRVKLRWPFENCTDAATLIPPPEKGWGVLNDISFGEWPISTDTARIVYNFVDESLDPKSVAYGQSRQNVSIYISSDTSLTKALRDALVNDNMRDIMFESGPYNYPKQKYANAALLGSYFVQVDGTHDTKEKHFKDIIGCAIDSGLIAEGVDKGSLTR